MTSPARLEARIEGSGHEVVLLPSLGRGAADFDDLAGRLAGAGLRAVMPEPRGARDGRDAAERAAITLHDLAADVAALVSEVCTLPVTVVGHAFGNRVARTLATDHPELVARVVLVAAGGAVPGTEDARASLRACFEAALPQGERLEAVRRAFFAPGNDPRVWLDGWDAELRDLQGTASLATPSDEWWDAGDAPILVLQGLDDVIAPSENGHRLAEAFPDRVTLVDIPDAGHALLPEQPERIAEAIVAFCRGV